MAKKRRRNRKKSPSAGTNKWKTFGIIAGSLMSAVIIIYMCVALYFTQHFFLNTYINGQDYSLKTVSQVEKFIEDEVNQYTLVIKSKELEKEISAKEISLKYKRNDYIDQILKDQKALFWIQAVFGKNEKKMQIAVSYDKDKLNNLIQIFSGAPENQQMSENAKPEFNGEQYIIKPEVIGTAVNQELFHEKVKEYISELKPVLDIEAENCYTVPEYTSTSKEVQDACDTANKYIQTSITYSMKEPVVVSKELISNWISVDDKMNVLLNTDAIKNWLSEFGDTYDTQGTTREFTTPTGKAATVSGGTYGWSIDEETELVNLENSIKNGETGTREPAYYNNGQAASHDSIDWGNTYVEVDLSQQHMWYVADGNVVLETDVVTGEPIPEKITPEGVYSILEKKRDKILVGEPNPSIGDPGYQTHVNYWMRVTWTGIGFHDATWQREFGGSLNTIKGVGSHGCINMSLDQASALYSLIEMGTPVIIHY